MTGQRLGSLQNNVDILLYDSAVLLVPKCGLDGRLTLFFLLES